MNCAVTTLTCAGCGTRGVDMLVRVGAGKDRRAFRCRECLADIARPAPRPIGSAAGRD